MKELLIYGIVGCLALMVQNIVYYMIISYVTILSATEAMSFGSFSGFLIAYYGHYKYTFKCKSNKVMTSQKSFINAIMIINPHFIKFAISTVITALINITATFIINDYYKLPAKYALIPTFIVPVLALLLGKFWVFNQSR